MKNIPRTLIAGDGPLMDYVTRRSQTEKLGVQLLGRIPHDEVVNHMLSCRLLVFPSLWHEPLSRTLIEACVLGIPSVATDTGGTPDIIKDGKTGLISPPEPKELARKLSMALKDKRLRGRLARNAEILASKNFTESAVVAKIEGVYRRAIGE
jgi:glycosyltransferase involved in cell wall biosynthesis